MDALTSQFLDAQVLSLDEELHEQAKIIEVPAGAEIFKPGAFIPSVPIVLSGLIRVSRIEDEKELLLYYIEPGQSCVMSLIAAINEDPIQVMAVSEMKSVVLLLPIEKFANWRKEYPPLEAFFLNQFMLRYDDLINTVDQLAFKKLDIRLYNYLREKAQAQGSSILQVTHQQIARELGTAREVISRTLKKLVSEDKISLSRNEIHLL